MNTTTTLTSQKNPKAFEKAIVALNRKASRLELPPIEFEMTGVRQVAQLKTVVFIDEGEVNEQETTVDVTVYDYEVTHLDVKQEGWTLLGRISKDTEGGVFTEGFSASFVRSTWEKRNPCECDHCHTSRDRHFGWALRNEIKGEDMLVGSTCAKLLLDGVTAAAFEFIAHVYNIINTELVECEGGTNSHKDEYCYVSNALAAVECKVEEDGKWTDNEKNYGEIVVEGTHRTVARMIRNSGYSAFTAHVTEKHTIAAENVIEALLEIDSADSFVQDLQYLVSREAIPVRKLGLLCYARRAVQKHQQKLDNERINSSRKYFGEVKKRYDLELTGVRCHSFDSAYGGKKHINTLEDADRNVYVWKTAVMACEEGASYVLKATIKEHSEYRGTPQTTLTRCKWLNETNLV